MKIGVGVEGPSDRVFWEKVLHKHFPGYRFFVRNMNGREKLIRQAPALCESFKNAHYQAGFILIDQDEDPCPPAVLKLFARELLSLAKTPLPTRFLFICVAVKKLESWLLADDQAIQEVIPGCDYTAPPETAQIGAARRLQEKVREGTKPSAGFNKRDFAEQMAPKFSPERARHHSASFSHFWTRLSAIAHC